LRCPDAPVTPWQIGEFDIATGIDTPGNANDCSLFVCNTCPGDTDENNKVDFFDIGDFVDAILGITPNPCADVNQDAKQDGLDVNLFISKVIPSGGLDPTPCVDVTLIRCDAGGDGSCTGATDFCLLQGSFNPQCSDLGVDNVICVQCVGGNCIEDTTITIDGRIIDGDGAGMDCTFTGNFFSFACNPCAAGTKRYRVVP
ncbi:MAG: hypothetical protein O7B26_07765, partial [Planctomycetota bacterium]|nr:hypothetical protein [Planctomycetota bacterium]